VEQVDMHPASASAVLPSASGAFDSTLPPLRGASRAERNRCATQPMVDDDPKTSTQATTPTELTARPPREGLGDAGVAESA
jgi:hypothetical protein